MWLRVREEVEMSKTYTVAEGHEFTYPADAISLRMVLDAGGVSQLTDEQREKIKFKVVKSGEDCTDMPVSSRNIYVQRGWVLENPEVVPDEEVNS
jgi:hypothetical protein